jgi:hypothetical protein
MYNKSKFPRENFPNLQEPDKTPSTTQGRNILSQAYSMEGMNPAPKPYKLRPPKTQRVPHITRNRKLHPQKEHDYSLQPFKQNTPEPTYHQTQLGGASASSHQYGIPSPLRHAPPQPTNKHNHLQTNPTRKKIWRRNT